MELSIGNRSYFPYAGVTILSSSGVRCLHSKRLALASLTIGHIHSEGDKYGRSESLVPPQEHVDTDPDKPKKKACQKTTS